MCPHGSTVCRGRASTGWSSSGLGAVWILDGLEVTIVGSIAARLTEKGSGIAITASGIGVAAAIYVAGACVGALFFGQLTDRFGRKRLFLLTLGVYIVATVATAFAFAPWYLFVARFFTGAGIGGEYAAINSAIDELIPARVRGRVDLMINGSYWLGAAIGSVAALLFLDTNLFANDFGWRLAFGMRRRARPVDPARAAQRAGEPALALHPRARGRGRADRRRDRARRERGDGRGAAASRTRRSRSSQRKSIPFREIAPRRPSRKYPQAGGALPRAVHRAGVPLQRDHVRPRHDPEHVLRRRLRTRAAVHRRVFAAGNFLGPLLLGRLFDTVGRKIMISLCYLASRHDGAMLALLLLGNSLTEWTFIALVCATFFLASAGASSAYLTVSEIFPMETRALAIAFFYAVGTAIGGITGPLLFGHLIDSGTAASVAIGFFIGAAVMALGGIAELAFGVRAEQQSLESIAEPLTAAPEAGGDERGEPADAKRSAPPRGERTRALPAGSRVVALVLAVHADDDRPALRAGVAA